ncbi:minor head protein inhibitor of protease [Enterobacteria phage GEC-3S]|uniref:Putative inhibitor of prohead protease n=1 Tax=Enterobacteria phage GEC-3S TaxID=1222338 RepID=A0A0B7MSX8_9CAUD|nr:minor head protein inhibitor of protease [Enterobacteria phage GEC-3S]CEO90777.1 Putative inhibitor of prohead protease [Enterobacteria phage GEC-3S]
MFDKEYFEELRAIAASDDKEAQKTAKTELADYAKQFDIKVKKTLSLENMIEFVETELTKLASEMEEETPAEGTSINDLILAADTADDKVVFDEVDPSLVEAMKEPEIVIEETKEESPAVEPVVEEVKSDVEEAPEVKVKSPVANIFSDEAEHRSPAHDTDSFCDLTGFRPTICLIGGGRGYYSCPWWIFDWIVNTPDWKKYPERFPHAYVHDTLKSLIYYIKRDGSVKVRETKHSQFHTLK